MPGGAWPLIMHNILLILTDQQRKDSLGCYGNPIISTPALDNLASRGQRFERNYVANPICMPSRLSIFTGQHTCNHRLWTNGLLIDERDTVATHLQRHGYQTASIGKIHFTPYGGKAGNRESCNWWKQQGGKSSDWSGPYWGFEEVELSLMHTQTAAHYGKWFYEKGGTDQMTQPLPDQTRPIPEHLHDSTWVAERTIERLKQRDRNKPFFLVASFPDPHHPFDPPSTTAAKYSPAAIPLPIGGPDDLASRPAHYRQHFERAWNRWGVGEPSTPNGIDETEARQRIVNTCAMVDLIDRNVGRILDQLDAEGLRDDTIVVFTSDHGELLGDHGLWLKGPFFYEGLINTPLIIAGPGIHAAVSKALFSDVDLAPTLCDLAGAPALPFADGRSQAPHLHNPNQTVRDACLIHYQTGYGEGDVASKVLVTERWKYVRFETGEEELTDLRDDPEERQNVVQSAACYEVLQEMRQNLLKIELTEAKPKFPAQTCHA